MAVGDVTLGGQRFSSSGESYLKVDSADGSLKTNSAVDGVSTVAIAAGASANVKASPGRLCRLLVTVAGTVSITLYDNAAGGATGTIIGIVPAATAIGQIYEFNLPAAVGISAVGAAGSPGVTIGFS